MRDERNPRKDNVRSCMSKTTKFEHTRGGITRKVGILKQFSVCNQTDTRKRGGLVMKDGIKLGRDDV
jgi:hypothetical protein